MSQPAPPAYQEKEKEQQKPTTVCRMCELTDYISCSHSLECKYHAGYRSRCTCDKEEEKPAKKLRLKLENNRDKLIDSALSKLQSRIEYNANADTMSSLVKWDAPTNFREQYFSLKSGTHKEKLKEWAKTQGYTKVEPYIPCDCSYNDNCSCSQETGITFYF
jgi:hypothetical protein